MDKVKNSYIFPDILAKSMSRMSQRLQFESAMMSMSFMMIGVMITIVYIIKYITFPTWYKVTIVINLAAALIFMWSNLITQFQQYQSYMAIRDFQQTEMKGGNTKDA